MAQTPAKRRNWGAFALVALLGGCAGATPAEPVTCPEILILADAHRITQFRPGGRDITDILAEGEITGYQGSCRNVDDAVEVTVALAFDIVRGPGNKDGQAAFSYFVAMPAFYPDPQAKAVLPVRVAFPENASSVRLVDEEVTLRVPLREGAPLPEIFIGFQLGDAQLRYNRQRTP